MTLDLDFSKLTVGDLKKIRTDAPMGDLIEFVNKVVVGGIDHLPANELGSILKTVFDEFALWLHAPAEDALSLAAMLRDVKGL